jgi:hypothetical protein
LALFAGLLAGTWRWLLAGTCLVQELGARCWNLFSWMDHLVFMFLLYFCLETCLLEHALLYGLEHYYLYIFVVWAGHYEIGYVVYYYYFNWVGP